MSMKTDYDVVTHREGDLWVFTIPSLSATGQATSLSAVTNEARGIIEAWTEDGPAYEDITVNVQIDGAQEARQLWNASDLEEKDARAALAHAAAQRRRAVSLLRQEKRYSAAETAAVLGVSRQRVYQLEKSAQ